MLWQRGRAYSQDLRERVFAAWEAGLRVGEIAEQLLVSIAYVSKALGREQRTGERTVRPQRCHITPKLAGHALGRLGEWFGAIECANYFRHAGYFQSA
jgi:transposase